MFENGKVTNGLIKKCMESYFESMETGLNKEKDYDKCVKVFNDELKKYRDAVISSDWNLSESEKDEFNDTLESDLIAQFEKCTIAAMCIGFREGFKFYSEHTDKSCNEVSGDKVDSSTLENCTDDIKEICATFEAINFKFLQCSNLFFVNRILTSENFKDYQGIIEDKDLLLGIGDNMILCLMEEYETLSSKLHQGIIHDCKYFIERGCNGSSSDKKN